LLKDVVITGDNSDILRRSIIRHNPEKLAKQIMDVFEGFDKK